MKSGVEYDVLIVLYWLQEIMSREVELDLQVSPQENMSREVELGCESSTSFASSCSSTAGLMSVLRNNSKRKKSNISQPSSTSLLMISCGLT